MAAWEADNSTVCPVEELKLEKAAKMAAFVDSYGPDFGVALIESRRFVSGAEMVVIQVDVDRPQDKKFDIRRQERIAVVAEPQDRFLTVLALREDFPLTPHQNSVPDGMPRSLCVDDRPWQEARLTWSPAECCRRIRQWLAKAARGELHDPAQPLEPLFYSSGTTLILPRSAIQPAKVGAPIKLIGLIRDGGDPRVVIAYADETEFKNPNANGRMAIVPIGLPDQVMSGIRNPPRTLSALAAMVSELGVDIIAELRKQISSWVAWRSDTFNALSAYLVVCVIGKVTDSAGSRSALDARAFLTAVSAGEVGVALGCLLPFEEAGTKANNKYVAALKVDEGKRGEDITIEPIDVQVDFDRTLGAEVSGAGKPDERRAALIGAGALGSHVALMLAREGAFKWSVIDKDALLPHNLARHGLPRWYLGHYKATALADHIRHILNAEEAAVGIVGDCLDPVERQPPELMQALSAADLIIDASASVAVERHLSNLSNVTARRFSAFFNPSGTAAVLLIEGKDRSISLREIEAQYYNSILTTPELRDHLAVSDLVRYSGSCRALTNRISERAAAILSGLIASGIKQGLDEEAGAIRIWSMDERGGVSTFEFDLQPPLRQTIGEWSVTVDGQTIEQLRLERQTHLPNETGGVLLGVVDFERRSIHVAYWLSAPPDSRGSVSGFERGIQGLESSISEASAAVANQIRYVGEWHSHPRDVSASPSETDFGQMCWLSMELASEGCPAVVLIVGDEDETLNLAMAVESAE